VHGGGLYPRTICEQPCFIEYLRRPTVHSRPSVFLTELRFKNSRFKIIQASKFKISILTSLYSHLNTMYTLKINSRKLLADTLTPVNVYLKLRDVYAGSLLLESSDYHGHENSLSIICCDPIAMLQVKGEKISVVWPDKKKTETTISKAGQVQEALTDFVRAFEVDGDVKAPIGIFGYMAYDAVRYFEDVKISGDAQSIPDVLYKVYRYLVVIDHFTNELTLIEGVMDGLEKEKISGGLDGLEQIIYSNRFSTFPFKAQGIEESNVTDEKYKAMVELGIAHCHRGDVFQIVLSRNFQQSFTGDEFNVYRALRSINPSPYLFYFDFGNFKIFGSSPEAQIQIKNGVANIFPIAGTFRRTGNDAEDALVAKRLAEDEKENAEHLMLVDLARNDLSRASSEVKVEVFKEIQYYSHVIHLVSKVSGKLNGGDGGARNGVEQAPPSGAGGLMFDTFPAGTLSGAPKHKAMNLISQIENQNRGFYGGALGFIGFNGDVNLAIMIRTFLSKDNQLISQAGAGVVAKSKPESELMEVNNKLEALRKAVVMAEGLVRY
jgi:anthranilate synthase component I